METLNEKFFNVTGLTWDLKQYIESLKTNGMTDKQISEKILWFIPDGAMIELEGRRQSLTEELLNDETLTELGIQYSDKIGGGGDIDNDGGSDDNIIDTDFGKVIIFIPKNEVGKKINLQNFNSRYFDNYPSYSLYQTINDSNVIICTSYNVDIIENAYNESYKDSTFMNLNYTVYDKDDPFGQYIKYEEYDGTNASEDINIFMSNHEIGSEFTLVFGDDYDYSTFNYNQITINSMKISGFIEICTEFTPTDNPRVFKGILNHKIEGNFNSETTIQINATMIPEIRLENFYGDAKIIISSKETGSEVRVFGLPEGYTPLSLLYYTPGDMSGEEVVNKFNHVIEDGIDIWKGYNLIENIRNSSFDDTGFNLRLKKPNGSISNVYISQNLTIEGQPVVDIYIYNETGNYVSVTFLNQVLEYSEFRLMELMQIQNDQDVILTKFDDGEYEGFLLNKYKEPDENIITTTPILIMKKTIDVVEGNPSENPEYTTSELYVSENNATLLLKDEFIDKYNFEVYKAYQIDEEGNLIELISEFNKDSNTGFIYHSNEINNYNNELETIITIESNNLNIQVYTPEPQRNAIFYYDDIESSNTVTIKFKDALASGMFTPGKLYYNDNDNDEDVVLVSEGNWIYLGYYAYSATLETSYDYQEPLYVSVLTEGEYTGTNEQCEVHYSSYVPQPNRLFIGSNEAENTITLVIGDTSRIDYNTVEEDYSLVGVYDSNDINIMNSFSNNWDGTFTGTLLAPINDINSDGYIKFEDKNDYGEEGDIVEPLQESVKFIEGDY